MDGEREYISPAERPLQMNSKQHPPTNKLHLNEHFMYSSRHDNTNLLIQLILKIDLLKRICLNF